MRSVPTLLIPLLVLPLLGWFGGDPVEPPPDAEDVVLLHGLWRSDRVMRPLEDELRAGGFRVHNLDYDSTDHPPEELVHRLSQKIQACCDAAERLHFVGHSLGGILVRAYLAEHTRPNLGRVVMLAPPNHGTELVDIARDNVLFELFAGPTALELGTDPDSLPNRLPPPHYEVGIIAGDWELNLVGAIVLEGESDGTVTVESAKLEGMKDFVTVSESHSRIMRADEVAEHTLHFLRRGRFAHEVGE
jgi:pimeloyl-ACP methyl ester carboxylesterase